MAGSRDGHEGSDPEVKRSMKKYVILGVFALALLAMPLAAAAANVGQFDVSGNLQRAITVEIVDYSDAPVTAFTFSPFVSGLNERTPFTTPKAPRVKAVVTGVGAWSVDESEPFASTNGKMCTAVPVCLTNGFQLGSNVQPYTDLTAADPWTGFMSGTGAGTVYADLYLKQMVEDADPDGNYGITLTFTGSAL